MGRLLVAWFLLSCLVVVATLTLLIVLTGEWLIKGVVLDPVPGYWTLAGWAGLVTSDSGHVLPWLGLYSFVVLPLATMAVALSGILSKQVGTNSNEVPVGEADPSHCVVVLTAYNDETSIGPAVKDFSGQPNVERVYVVDNNSSDTTAKTAERAGAIVVREPNQGYGHACIRGLSEALATSHAGTIVLSEGDMTFFGSDIPKLLAYISDADLVLGTRTTRPLTFEGSQMDWFLVWGNRFLALLVKLRYWDPVFLGKVSVTDVGCTFRAIRRESLARILPQLDTGGDSFSPHMVGIALRNHLKIVEVPIRFRQRVGVSKGAGGSRLRATRIGFEMISEILGR